MVDLKVRIFKYLPLMLLGLYTTKKIGIIPLVIAYLEMKVFQRENMPVLLDKGCQTSHNETSSQNS